MTNADRFRIRFLAIFTASFTAVITALAIVAALDPNPDALWQTWGYLQKGACLLVISAAWPLHRLCMVTFFDTFDTEDDLDIDLERVCRNPRVPEAQ